MARHLLTDAQIKTHLKAAVDGQDKLIADGEGLFLRVTGPGKAAWFFKKMIAGKTVKLGLGGLNETTITQARERAEEKRILLRQGAMPEKGQMLEGPPRTVDELFTRFDAKNGAKAYRSALYKTHIRPRLGNLRLDDMKRPHVLLLLDDIKAADKKRTAGAVFGVLRQVLSWGLSRGFLSHDPLAGAKRKEFGHQGARGERWLKEPELRELNRRFAELRAVGPDGRSWNAPVISVEAMLGVCLLIATGTRITETALGRWVDIDCQRAEWLIPGETRKKTRTQSTGEYTGKPHLVHLSPYALEVLELLRRLNAGREHFFPMGQGLTKQLGDRQETRTKKERGWATNRVCNDTLLLPGGRFTTRDLRRTTGSTMKELGILPHVTKACQSQGSEDAIIETYQTAEMLTARRKAFDKLGAYLAKAMPLKPIARLLESHAQGFDPLANVLPLERGRRQA